MSWPLRVKYASKITFAQCKCRTFQSIIYPADKNNFIGISSTLAWGKSRVGLPPAFFAKNLNSYLYMLINERHTQCLHVPFLFHWQIYGQQPSSTSSPRDKRKKAEWTSKKQTSVDDFKNETSILNRITIVFHHCVSLIWTNQWKQVTYKFDDLFEIHGAFRRGLIWKMRLKYNFTCCTIYCKMSVIKNCHVHELLSRQYSFLFTENISTSPAILNSRTLSPKLGYVNENLNSDWLVVCFGGGYQIW